MVGSGGLAGAAFQPLSVPKVPDTVLCLMDNSYIGTKESPDSGLVGKAAGKA